MYLNGYLNVLHEYSGFYITLLKQDVCLWAVWLQRKGIATKANFVIILNSKIVRFLFASFNFYTRNKKAQYKSVIFLKFLRHF